MVGCTGKDGKMTSVLQLFQHYFNHTEPMVR